MFHSGKSPSKRKRARHGAEEIRRFSSWKVPSRLDMVIAVNDDIQSVCDEPAGRRRRSDGRSPSDTTV
jgi:hypothetical protein